MFFDDDRAMDTHIPWMPEEGEPIPAELNLRCTHCGYELTGLIERRCPECGEEFDPRETWLENEQSTWAYHFENVRPKKVYAIYAMMFGMAVIYGLMIGVNIFAIFGVLLIVVGEIMILQFGAPAIRTRLIYLIACLLWSFFVWLINPF